MSSGLFNTGIDQEKVIGSLSLKGIIYGVTASMFVSLNSIYTEQALTVLDGNVWEVQLYHNLIACFVFIPMMCLFGEVQILLANQDILVQPMFWSLLLLSGVFACGIGYVTSLQIKFTSPLTHTISGTAKAAVQTVLATAVYHETKTFSWWLSNVIVLFSSAAYARVRQLEMITNKTNKNDNIKYKKLNNEHFTDASINTKHSQKLPI